MRFLLYFLLSILFLSNQPLAPRDLHTVNSSHLTSILDSKKAGYWEATLEIQNPDEYFSKWESGEDVGWKPYFVPGDLTNIFPAPFVKNQKFYIRKEFLLPDDWVPGNYSIRIGQISDRDRTFLNGVLIGSTGKMDEIHIQADGIHRVYDIPQNILRSGKKNILLIEVQTYYKDSGGIIRDGVTLGPSSLIYKEITDEDNFKLYFIVIYSALFFVFLFTYFFRTEDKEYLFFSIFIFNYVYYQVLQLQLIYDWGLSYRFIEHISYIFSPFLFVTLSHFISRYFNYKYSIIHKILDLLIIGSRLILIFIMDIEIQRIVLNNFIIYIYVIYLLLYFYWIFKRAFQKNRDAIYMSIAMFIFSIGIVFDLLVILGKINSPKIGNVLFMFFILGLAVVLYAKIERLEKELRSLNEVLEEKVVRKTRELNDSLFSINKMKTREDNLYLILGNSLKKSVIDIKDFSELLLKYENINDEERLNLLNSVLKESEELNISLENLIFWAKIQSNRIDFQVTTSTLKEVITESIGILKEFAFKKNIKLKFEITDSVISTDITQLGFIIRKLFSNSLKFTPEGGSVFLVGKVSADEIHIKIKDSGIGIEPILLDKLIREIDFEDDLSRTGTKPNLGMKICNRFIHLLRGKISIQSNLETGTETSILVPSKN